MTRRSVTADQALAGLFSEHYLGLVRLAIQLVDDQPTAEDVVQDVFSRLPSIMPRALPDDPLHYLRRAVVNRSRSVLRRRRTNRAFDAAGPSAIRASPSAETSVVARERDIAIQRAVAALPSRQREVRVLRYFEQLSTAETAAVLGISAGAVASSAGRAFTTLTRTFAKDSPSSGFSRTEIPSTGSEGRTP